MIPDRAYGLIELLLVFGILLGWAFWQWWGWWRWRQAQRRQAESPAQAPLPGPSQGPSQGLPPSESNASAEAASAPRSDDSGPR